MTKQEYAEYEERVAFYMKGIEHTSTGPCASCEECQRDRGQTKKEMESASELHEDPWFSWHPCEVCNRPEGGNRVSWHGVIKRRYQPKTGAKCSCKRGVQRDNCSRCEGTGQVVDFARIRNTRSECVHGSCCEDCAYYFEYGRLDDTTMEEISS